MKILREPLVHFILLGAVIFAVFGFVNRYRTNKPGEIVVTQGTVENIITGFTRTWQRPPTEDELRGLVRDYIREEAAYREALAEGLDRDDTIVRRRLRQKLEFLSDNIASRAEPTDADLQAFLQTHPAFFQSEPLFSFRQVYVNPGQHGANLSPYEARLLVHLQRAGPDADLSSLGDPFLLAQSFQDVSLAEVKQVFGDQFAAALSAVPTNQWQGPIASGYGAHMVFLSRHIASRLPALSEVRDQVRREWSDARRLEATEKFYQTLLRRYTVKVESPEEKKVAQVH
jgi:parvulin-like peptidyl-prolyl cis-trans isomerase-like protein